MFQVNSRIDNNIADARWFASTVCRSEAEFHVPDDLENGWNGGLSNVQILSAYLIRKRQRQKDRWATERPGTYQIELSENEENECEYEVIM
jgi:hypothetical protein